jgi:hypothetical protein
MRGFLVFSGRSIQVCYSRPPVPNFRVICIIPLPYPASCALVKDDVLVLGNMVGAVDYYNIETGNHMCMRVL